MAAAAYSTAGGGAPWRTTRSNTVVPEDDGAVFYGGLCARVLAENTAALGAAGPVTRGRVDGKRGHPILDVIDAQIFVGGERSRDAIAVRCTLRAAVVIGISLRDISDLRRTDGGSTLEVDFSAPEESAAIGRLRRRHTLIVQSTRGDTEAIHALYYTAAKAHRAAVSGPAAGDGSTGHHHQLFSESYSGVSHDPPSRGAQQHHQHDDHLGQHHHRIGHSSSFSYAGEESSRNGGGGGASPGRSFDTAASQEAAAELARIQERRRQRQRLLVGDMLSTAGGGTNSYASAAPQSTSYIGSRGGGGMSQTTSPPTRGGGGGGAAAHEMQWCRWCNDFQPGERHGQTCENRPVECSWCERRMTQRDFAKHQFDCRAMPDFQVAAEQEKMRREREWRRALKARERRTARRMGESSDSDSSGSDTTSERRRARRRARRAVKEEAAAAAAVAPVVAAAAPAAGPTEDDEFERYGRRCIWCKKPKPKDHDPKCSMRRVLCKACHTEVFLKDKDAHRMACKKRPGRSATEVLGAQKERAAQQQQQQKGVAFKEGSPDRRSASPVASTSGGREL